MGRDARGSIDAVVIGASVGGVEALSLLFAALPAGFRPPILVVVHLPRERPSLLSRILGRGTLPAKEAIDKEPIVPGTIYFAPPDYHLLVDRDARVALSVDDPVQFCRPSIDVLFESAADAYASALLAIVLTGNNDDGAAGLAAVQRCGGRVVVQDPDEAKGSTMPAAALQRVPRAEVKSLERIASMLRSLDGETV